MDGLDQSSSEAEVWGLCERGLKLLKRAAASLDEMPGEQDFNEDIASDQLFW